MNTRHDMRILDQALARASDLADDLDRDVTFTRGLSVHDLAPASGLAQALARDRARAHDLDRDLTRARGYDLLRDLARPVALAQALSHDLDLAHDRDRARALARDLGRARDRTRAIARDLNHACARARDRADLAALRDDKTLHGRPAVHVTVPAGRLVAAATRLLPAADQARFGEEYRSELWELAAAGAARR